MEWLDNIEESWRDAVTRWKATVNDFGNAYNLHLENQQKATEMGERDAWLDMLDRANKVRTAVEMLQESLAATSTWAKDTLGLSSLKRMGFIPLIPVAVITGSIAAVVSITYTLYSYNSELQRKWEYIGANPNMTPEQVTNLLTAAPEGPIGSALAGVGNLAVWIVIGGLLLTFGPQLLSRWKR